MSTLCAALIACAAEREVTVFLHREETVVPVVRSVSGDAPQPRASLEALLAGPTPEERAAGLSSWFSTETAGVLRSVEVTADGAATVDFADLHVLIPNASSSAGSALLLASLDSTMFRVPGVQSVEYRLNGSCDAFWEWLQRACTIVQRPAANQ